MFPRAKSVRGVLAAIVVLVLVGMRPSTARPITLLDRHGDLSVQAPKNIILEPAIAVGVNTNAPQELLDIAGDLAVTGGLRLGPQLLVRACDTTSDGLLAAPSDIGSSVPALRQFWLCDGTSWVPAGEAVNQDRRAADCQDHPWWGRRAEYDMYQRNGLTGAPEKVRCHSETHMSARPVIHLKGKVSYDSAGEIQDDPQPELVTLDLGDDYEEYGIIVLDADHGSLPNAPTSDAGFVDTLTPGTYYKQYSAWDDAGHAAHPVVRTVVVSNPQDAAFTATAYLSCVDAKAKLPTATSGVFWVDPVHSGVPFRVYCDMETDGGGWFKLKLTDSFSNNNTQADYNFDDARVAMWQWSAQNTWAKCSDDAGEHYRPMTLTEDDIKPVGNGYVDQSFPLKYAICLNPDRQYKCATSSLELTWVQVRQHSCHALVLVGLSPLLERLNS
jgi:hypothetical protein